MSKQERQLWIMIRRGMLLACAAIGRERDPPPLFVEVRRGLLLICAAIEQECTAGELV